MAAVPPHPAADDVLHVSGEIMEIDTNESDEELPELSESHPASEFETEDGDGAKSIASTGSERFIQDVMENGRRYCNSTYFMPNDEAEQTRLNIIHQAFLILLSGDLTKAPVPQGASRILDVGTGPGDWAVEMGERYPDAVIIATDISVFDAGPAVLGLPNVQFQFDDAEEEWTYHESFDLIHFRGLSGSFRDWIAVYRQAFKHLKPGGYVEVVEWDSAADIFNVPKGETNSYLDILISAMRNIAEATGYPRGREHLQRSSLTSVGFVDVRQYDLPVPIGTWPDDPRQKTLGKMALIVMLEGLEAICLRQLTASGKWTVEEVRDLCEKVKLEILSSERASISVRFLTGRKPMSAAPARLKNRRRLDKILREIENSYPSG